jgi:predicted permease
MFSTLLVVLPIFALILAGFVCRRIGVLGPASLVELNRFVVYLGLPALLFDIMANTTWEQLYQPGFIAAFGLGCAIVQVLVVLIRYRRRPLADASIDGLNGAYANTGYMGFPLGLLVFGPQSLTSVTIASIITVCLVFAGAIILIETGLQAERHPLRLIAKVATALAKNPLLVSPVLGAGLAATGWHMPPPVETFFKLLGGAASPCALVALGLFLAEKRPAGNNGTSLALTVVKLVVHPLVTWVLAYKVFAMPPLLAASAVLLAALPTGTGPFMLAEFYRREADVTARTVLFSTVISVVTLAALIYLIRHGLL